MVVAVGEAGEDAEVFQQVADHQADQGKTQDGAQTVGAGAVQHGKSQRKHHVEGHGEEHRDTAGECLTQAGRGVGGQERPEPDFRRHLFRAMIYLTQPLPTVKWLYGERPIRQIAEPTTLLEAIRYYSDLDVATKAFSALRWPDGVTCPYCLSKQNYYAPSRRIWKCKVCRKQFSPKVGTVCEDSPIGFDKWLTAMWMIASDKNGISSWELHRGIGVTQKTAWFMLQRIRLAMQTGTFEKASGQVEVDETFIGGKARNMHKHIRQQKITGTGGSDKTMVVGVLQRGGKVRANVINSRKNRRFRPTSNRTLNPERSYSRTL